MGLVRTAEQFNKKYENSGFVVKTVSFQIVRDVLEEEGVKIDKKGYCFRPRKHVIGLYSPAKEIDMKKSPLK